MFQRIIPAVLALAWLAAGAWLAPDTMAQPAAGGGPGGFDDHQNMMDQLGVKALRPGPNGNDPSINDESTANRYADSMPDALTMQDGMKVARAEQWPKRRAEIEELFAREVYGRIPDGVPAVQWEVTTTTQGVSGGVPTVTKVLAGHVDNSAYPDLSVTIQASFTVPAGAKAAVPMIVEFGGFFGGGPRGGFGRIGGRRGAAPTSATLRGRGPAPAARGARGPGAAGGPPPWTQQAIAKGWGYGYINPGSIQPDNTRLTTGIIGLTNKGQPRKPDQWGRCGRGSGASAGSSTISKAIPTRWSMRKRSASRGSRATARPRS
jgi:hypothetical protein